MRNLLIVIGMLMGQLAFAQTTDVVFDQKGKVFKDLKEGEVLTFSYNFENKGSTDFIITGVHPTCGCTAVEWPKQAIKPGESAKIDVSFDTEGRPGYNAKGVNIHSNRGEISLVFEAYVTSKDGRVPDE